MRPILHACEHIFTRVWQITHKGYYAVKLFVFLLRTLFLVRRLKARRETVATTFFKLARESGSSIAIKGDNGTTMSRLDLRNAAMQVARHASMLGWRRGDVVALKMQNCPEYVALWLGLSVCGVTVSLIPTQLSGESLIHAVRISSPVAVLTDDEESMPSVIDVPVIIATSLLEALGTDDTTTPTFIPERHPDAMSTDTLFYIFTSGTVSCEGNFCALNIYIITSATLLDFNMHGCFMHAVTPHGTEVATGTLNLSPPHRLGYQNRALLRMIVSLCYQTLFHNYLVLPVPIKCTVPSHYITPLAAYWELGPP